MTRREGRVGRQVQFTHSNFAVALRPSRGGVPCLNDFSDSVYKCCPKLQDFVLHRTRIHIIITATLDLRFPARRLRWKDRPGPGEHGQLTVVVLACVSTASLVCGLVRVPPRRLSGCAFIIMMMMMFITISARDSKARREDGEYVRLDEEAG